jgi:hypothetical protein
LITTLKIIHSLLDFNETGDASGDDLVLRAAMAGGGGGGGGGSGI